MARSGKKSKDEVNYGEGYKNHYCGDCVHFIDDGRERAFGHCALVAGLIGRRMWCRLFEPKTAKQGRS